MFIFIHQIVCTDDELMRHEKSKHKHSKKHKKEKKHKKSDEDKQLLKAAKKFLKESASYNLPSQCSVLSSGTNAQRLCCLGNELLLLQNSRVVRAEANPARKRTMNHLERLKQSTR